MDVIFRSFEKAIIGVQKANATPEEQPEILAGHRRLLSFERRMKES